MFVSSQSNAQHPGQDLFHHAFHGRNSKCCLICRIPEIKANIPLLNINTTENKMDTFLARHLNNCSITASLNDLSPVDDNISIIPNPLMIGSTKGKSKHYNVEILDAVGQVKDELGKIANDAPVVSPTHQMVSIFYD